MRFGSDSVRAALRGAAFGVMLAAGPAAASDEAWLSSITPRSQAVASAAALNNGPHAGTIAAFYRARAFAPMWTTGDAEGRARLAALLRTLERAPDHGLPAARFDADALVARLSSARGVAAQARLEVDLSATYLALADALSAGIVTPGRIDPSVMKREVLRRDPAALLDAMAAGRPSEVMQDLAPRSPEYVRLMGHLKRLESAVRRGGWGPEVAASKLSPGDEGPDVVALRERLRAKGLMAPSLSARYDAALTEAVRAFQERLGLEPDGVAGPATIAAVNVSAEARLGAVLVAMERERWLSGHHRDGRMIWVNLPEFRARIIDDGITTFTTRAVIGARGDGKATPEFSDTMEYMVVNPSWSVPRGIIARDYLPMLRANPYALRHLDIVDRSGRSVNRGAGFRQYTARSFPFSIRQKPGPNNALGLVKFMFPNPHAIYLHDTPAKHLFDRTVRDYSSGCIRLAEPFDFAHALLARQEAEPEAFFDGILRSRAERRVNLEASIPVHLVYRTAFTDARGGLHFRDDIYGRDAKVLAALREAGVRTGDAALELAEAAGDR